MNENQTGEAAFMPMAGKNGLTRWRRRGVQAVLVTDKRWEFLWMILHFLLTAQHEKVNVACAYQEHISRKDFFRFTRLSVFAVLSCYRLSVTNIAGESQQMTARWIEDTSYISSRWKITGRAWVHTEVNPCPKCSCPSHIILYDSLIKNKVICCTLRE